MQSRNILKSLLFFIALNSNAVAVTPFDCFFVSGGVLVANGKLEMSRNITIAPAPAAMKRDTSSVTSPIFLGTLGVMKLFARCVIFGLECVASYNLKGKYNGDESKIECKANKVSIGLGITFGFLLSGNSFIYISPNIEGISISMKSSDPTDNPFEAKKSSALFSLKIGAYTAVNKTLFINVYAGIGNKSFADSQCNSKFKFNKRVIGASFIIRLSPLI